MTEHELKVQTAKALLAWEEDDTVEVEYCLKLSNVISWQFVKNPKFTPGFHYRIKPTYGWVNIYKKPDGTLQVGNSWESRKLADEQTILSINRVSCIKFLLEEGVWDE